MHTSTRQTALLDHDGAELAGQFVAPARPGPLPAVLILPTAAGLGEHELTQAQRLAELGYVALAADMYGGGVHHDDPRAAGPAFSALLASPQLLRARVNAWHQLLQARAEVDAACTAAIGYCFGGKCVLELARSGADVEAVVSFHGLLTTALPAAPGDIKCEVSIYTGGKDPYVPPADVATVRQELTAAGARWQLTEFGDACHAFTEPQAANYGRPGIAYDALADQLSWAGMLALLAATIGPSRQRG